MKKLLFTLLIFLPSTALAELTLADLAKQCEGESPKPAQPTLGILMCVSYIGGALDQLILDDGLKVQQGVQDKRKICGPEQGKVEKIASIVKFAAKERPEMRDKPARTILRGIIIGEFECK